MKRTKDPKGLCMHISPGAVARFPNTSKRRENGCYKEHVSLPLDSYLFLKHMIFVSPSHESRW